MTFTKYIKVNADVLDVSKENIQIKQLQKIYYLTGWLSSFRKGTNFNIMTNLNNISSIQLIKEEVLKHVDMSIKNKLVYLKFFSKKVSEDCKKNIEYVLSLKDDSIKKFFIIGVLESQASLLNNDTILFDSKVEFVESILKELKVPYVSKFNQNNDLDFIMVESTNIMDFLGSLYNDVEIYSESGLYCLYDSLKKKYYNCVDVEYADISNQILPKSHYTDAGIDISGISVDKVLDNGVIMLNTGVQLNIPTGYWGMLAPRSSIAKSGFMIANSFGVIDSSYRGELKIAITPINKDGNMKLVLPFKCAQLILMPQVMINFKNVDIISIETKRGEGAYGSTNANVTSGETKETKETKKNTEIVYDHVNGFLI
jgi:dUTP pyrophosphatase